MKLFHVLALLAVVAGSAPAGDHCPAPAPLVVERVEVRRHYAPPPVERIVIEREVAPPPAYSVQEFRSVEEFRGRGRTVTRSRSVTRTR